jgi:hypothetical protein
LLDNLVRAYEGQLFIHLSYTQLTGDVRITTQANADYDKNDYGRITGTAKFWGIFGSVSKANRINVVSVPVTDNESVYMAYIKFANNSKYFGRTNDKNSIELKNAHLSWEKNGYYYFIQGNAKNKFQELIIQTTMAAKTIAVGKEIIRKIKQVDEISGNEGYEPKDKTQHFLLLTFGYKVPNYDGELRLTLEGNLERVFKVLPVKEFAVGGDSKQLVLFYSESAEEKGHDIKVSKLKKMLIGADISLELRGLEIRQIPIESFHPTQKLERLQLQQLRLQQPR